MSKNELMVAAFEGRTADVRALLHLYAGLADANGQTAMMFAASAGRIECVRLLVEKERRMQVSTGETALMFAAYNNQEAIVSFLLPYEKRMQDAGGQTALMSSVYKRSVGCFRLLLEAEAGIQGKDGATALMIASRLGWTDLVDLARHKEACLTDNSGMTALMFAAQTGKWQCGQMLISQEGGMRSVTGRSALMIAAAAGHIEMVRLLTSVEAGLQDAQGHTALMYAAYSGRAQAVEALLSYESGCRDNNHNTALLLAIQNYHVECAILLVETEEALRNSQGQSPLDLAKALGLTKIVNEIIHFCQRRLKLSASLVRTTANVPFTLAENSIRKLSPDCIMNGSLKTPTMTPAPVINEIKDSQMLVEELEHTGAEGNVLDSEIKGLIDFYENSSDLIDATQPKHPSIDGESRTQLKALPSTNLHSVSKLANDTPSRSSGPGHTIKTRSRNNSYQHDTFNQCEIQETISQLSQRIDTISDSLSNQEHRIEELIGMMGKVLNLPHEQAEGKPNPEELWEATRQLVKQNESQMTALGYNLRSVQKNIRGMTGDFEKFKENSKTCLKALEQRCAQMSSKIDEERSNNKRSISALQIEVAELKSRTPCRSSKSFSIVEPNNSEDENNAISPRISNYHAAYGVRRITPRSQSAVNRNSNVCSRLQHEHEQLHLLQESVDPPRGFIKRLKMAIRYIFSGTYDGDPRS